MDTILLTGASGYLGSRISAILETRGKKWKPLHCRLEDIKLGSLDCDIVIHCAGALRNQPTELHSVNCEGTARLLRGLPPEARVIYVSSRSVYANSGHRQVDEKESVAPWDDYGRSKLAAEELIRRNGRNSLIFRSSALFGHPMRSGTFPDHAFDRVIAGQPIHLARPERYEDYLDVDSFAAVLVDACAAGKHWGGLYNIAGPMRPLSSIVAALVDVVSENIGHEPVVIPADIPVPLYPLLEWSHCKKEFPHFAQPSDREIFTRMMARTLAPRS